jgi:4-hydroxy-4-methyl-2-oxoglutarate aldolase
VSIGEVPVHPGDIVIGDIDGVVVVQANRVEEVSALAVKQREKENDRETRRNGESLVEILRLG